MTNSIKDEDDAECNHQNEDKLASDANSQEPEICQENPEGKVLIKTYKNRFILPRFPYKL